MNEDDQWVMNSASERGGGWDGTYENETIEEKAEPFRPGQSDPEKDYEDGAEH